MVHHEVPADEWGDVAAISDPDGAGPRISFLRVDEPRTVKNRLHLDLQVSGAGTCRTSCAVSGWARRRGGSVRWARGSSRSTCPQVLHMWTTCGWPTRRATTSASCEATVVTGAGSGTGAATAPRFVADLPVHGLLSASNGRPWTS